MPSQEPAIVELPELHLIGLSVTSVHSRHDPDRVAAMKREFFERRGEIPNPLHPDRYISPHFSTSVLFTYLICMEVSELSAIPEGMLGFTVPARRYVGTKSPTDPYLVIHNYLRANGLQADPKSLALEVYSFANPEWPAETDVYVPLLG
ncbi:hypothetical protein J31TS4_34260 [Paenibacillus sp. J31TS4]|uniref:GyrI-like domain-containing protein n=1 Tax=Paenibacillus sp. J31TS4 TaxID=2807195 RepID=UPI001B2474DB|nr:GyrI-like domain-containing protein [Paenibacillus sp. J31TS4]GIP40146.1 hypothetical protein J31TS4_34260 [Paenibacillus sp. J31TS4]